jgi:hypothetical protein
MGFDGSGDVRERRIDAAAMAEAEQGDEETDEEIYEDEEEYEEGQDMTRFDKALMLVARIAVTGSFIWLIMCLTAMLIGRAEPLHRRCPDPS